MEEEEEEEEENGEEEEEAETPRRPWALTPWPYPWGVHANLSSYSEHFFFVLGAVVFERNDEVGGANT